MLMAQDGLEKPQHPTPASSGPPVSAAPDGMSHERGPVPTRKRQKTTQKKTGKVHLNANSFVGARPAKMYTLPW